MSDNKPLTRRTVLHDNDDSISYVTSSTQVERDQETGELWSVDASMRIHDGSDTIRIFPSDGLYLRLSAEHREKELSELIHSLGNYSNFLYQLRDAINQHIEDVADLVEVVQGELEK